MKICVYGAGAVGGHIAAKLARTGHDVSVVVRENIRQAIETRGLTLQAGGEHFTLNVRAETDPHRLGPQDLVIFTVKATAIPELDGFQPLFGPTTSALFILNGIPFWYKTKIHADVTRLPQLAFLDPGQRVLRAVGADRIIGGVIFSGNIVIEPGIVQNRSIGRNEITLGELDGSISDRVSGLARTFEQAGFTSLATSDIRSAIWNKLIESNISIMPICVLTRRPSAVLVSPGLERIARALMAEGKRIATAHGIQVKIDPDGAFEPRLYSSNHKPSMLQDIENGRPAEIDSILVAVQEFARAADIPAPHLDTVTALIIQAAVENGSYL